MKTFITATLVTLASVAAGQLSNIPECALNCFLTPLGSDGCSDLTDFACHCKKSDSLFAAVTPCVQKACSAEEQATVISAVEQTCADAGVTIDVPTPGGSSTPAPSSTAEPSSEAPSETPTPTEVTSTVVETTAASSAPSVGLPTPSGNGTSPTGAPSPSVSEFPGSAARATQAAGLLGVAALAMLAL
jgi:hypothetical protein